MKLILNKSTIAPVDTKTLLHKLDVLSESANKMYIGNEGLQSFSAKAVQVISNTLVSIALINKTNITSLLSGFSRSEMRQYVDANYITLQNVMNGDILKYKDAELDIPDGMVKAYEDSVEWLEDIYEELDLRIFIDTVTRDVNALYNTLLSATDKKEFEATLDISDITTYYTGLDKEISSISKSQIKYFKATKGDSIKRKFSTCYSSTKEIGEVVDELLDMESTYPLLKELSEAIPKVADTMKKTVGLLGKLSYELPKQTLDNFTAVARTIAIMTELYGELLNTQMRLEHNVVLNIEQLNKISINN